ncbi:MAG: PD-(D/E)XK nuclease family transposase, partial [Acetatifactor sp.]|nr:PD-(D/E)XK nuclease family transposase [Acetatifactor sp.]
AMTYLCRNFDQLSRGEDYISVKPTIHIGFLDFTLFPDYPEFYATYKIMNVKNHHVFTDKIALSVVNLKHIKLATQEDREWKIDYWASLFKATTWEELKMLAKQNPILEDAVETIYELTADEAIREQCKAREKHIREMNTILREREIAVQARDEAVQRLDEAVQRLDEAIRAKNDTAQLLEQQTRQIEQLLKENRQLKEQQVLNANP